MPGDREDLQFDGLIGADVFQRFLVGIDFVKMELALDPRPKTEPASGDDPEDAGNEPAAKPIKEKVHPGFYRKQILRTQS